MTVTCSKKGGSQAEVTGAGGSGWSFSGEAKQRQLGAGEPVFILPSPLGPGHRRPSLPTAPSSRTWGQKPNGPAPDSGRPQSGRAPTHLPPSPRQSGSTSGSELGIVPPPPTCCQGSHAWKPHPEATPTVAGRASIYQCSSPDAGDYFCEFPSNDKGSACPNPAVTGEAPGDSAESKAGK